MYYYEKYDPYVLFVSFFCYSILLILLFKKKISSMIDPLLVHLIWCSSGLSLISGYCFSRGLNLDVLCFFLVYLTYLLGIYFFLENQKVGSQNIQKLTNNEKKWTLFLVFSLLNIVSRLEFIMYAFENPNIVQWFLYKFKQTESRNFVQYILQIGARPYFIYYALILLHSDIKNKKTVVFLLVLNTVSDIFAGGRSSLIGLIIAYGFFVHKYKGSFSAKKLRRLNTYSLGLIVFSLTIGSLITSFYNANSNFGDGVMSMINRLLAAGDGVEMYLSNNASKYIDSGLLEYVKSVFGIFIKRVININSQSIGWQLYELDSGQASSFAVGPNYILPLQAFTFGKIFIPFYCIAIAGLVAFLRGNRTKNKLVKSQSLSYVLGLISFEPVLDMELFIIVICSVFLNYFLFVLPINKIKIFF